MILSFKYKIKPNSSQKALMDNWLNMLRSHYNFCLADRINSYEEVRQPRLGDYSSLKTKAPCCPFSCSVSKNTSIGEPYKKSGKIRGAYEQQSSELPRLKKTRPWYKQISSVVLQQNLRRLDTAFKNFFDGRGYPRFKTRQRFKSFNYPPNQVKLDGNKIYLPSIGGMRFHQSRKIPDGFSLRSVTVRKKADGWYVAIQIEDKTVPQYQPMDLGQVKTVIGADLGVKKLVALSNGERIKNPQFEKQLERSKTIRQRRASRKRRGSRNQKKTFQRLARLEQKIVNKRNDYQWKVAHRLTRLADVIILEDLNVSGMMKRCKPKKDEKGKYLTNGQSAKRALNRLIRDCSWGELKLKIKSVAEKFGDICVEVDPKQTSQKCSQCGHTDKESRKKERFVCTECGFIADADIQASVNIGRKGLEKLGISPSKLLGVPQKVTPKSESTDSRNGDRSVSLETEPRNPRQRAFVCSSGGTAK